MKPQRATPMGRVVGGWIPCGRKQAWRGWLALASLGVPVASAATPGDVEEMDRVHRQAELACMTDAIAYEAGNEPLAGREAVAQVILNRLRDPAYPKTICGVVYQGSTRRTGCQFTFTCDGSTARRLSERMRGAAQEVARRALDGELALTVGSATHYHADYVAPYWAPSLVRVGAIGAHIFYRRPGARDVMLVPAGERGASARPPTTAVFTAWGLVAGSIPLASR